MTKTLEILLIIVALWHHGIAQPLATGKEKFLGSCIGVSIRSDFTKYWNQVTAENAGKWSSVEGTMDTYNWTALDNIYNFAVSNGFAYRHHNLVWGNQQPSWMTATLDSAVARAQVEEWIRLVGERYPNIDFIDVVNEPLNAPPAYKNALGGNGATGWDWVVTVFKWARKYCPSAQLHINEYNILQSNLVTDRYAALIDTLKVRGLIDGIGIQGHYFELRYYSPSTLQNNLNRLATATGLPIYITEFDIDESNDNTQLQRYQTYFPLFWDHPAVKGITLWGYAENMVWKPYAFVIDYRGAPRPALQWLSNYVAGPAKPVLISPLAGAEVARNPKLIWRSSASATSYHIQVSEDSTFGFATTEYTTTDTVYQLNPLRPNTSHYWHVSATNSYGTTDYSLTASFMTGSSVVGVEEERIVPGEFALYQNFPNPFNPRTAISFQLKSVSIVRLSVYDGLGREITTLVNEERPAGVHTVTWNAQDVPSGLYICRLTAGTKNDSKKMLLLK